MIPDKSCIEESVECFDVWTKFNKTPTSTTTHHWAMEELEEAFEGIYQQPIELLIWIAKMTRPGIMKTIQEVF